MFPTTTSKRPLPAITSWLARTRRHEEDANAPARRFSLRDLGRPATTYLASRLVTVAAAGVAADLLPGRNIGLGWVLKAWDAGWYLRVAEHGYPQAIPYDGALIAQSNLGFFPLFPMVVRAVHWFGIPYDIALLGTAGFFGLLAVLLLWILLERMWGRSAADRGVALFCFFPGTLAFSIGYSEPLMLMLAIGCLLALLERRWWTAGVLAALAGATRPSGAVLALPCLWAAVEAIRARRDWRSLIAPFLAPAGMIGFFAFLQAHTGHWDVYMRTQEQAWNNKLSLDAPWFVIENFFRHPFLDTNITVEFFGMLFLLPAAYVLVRSRPPTVLLLYAAGVMGFALFGATMAARPRFILTAFPLITSLGKRPSPLTFSILLGCFAAVLGALTVLSLSSLVLTP